ncbi:hypothetical protein PTKIN_Ptkin19aG0073000 [Pterospermum kingtungense]
MEDVRFTKVLDQPIEIPGGYPDTVDWRVEKAVSAVRNQNGCCCCWAMTAVLVTESKKKIQFQEENLQVLSPQKLIDCVLPDPPQEKIHPRSGCYVHTIIKAFDWWINNTVPSEESYPFDAKKGPCLPSQGGVRIKNYKTLKGYERLEILKAVASFPVAAVINVTEELLDLKKGIYDGPDSAEFASAASSTVVQDIQDRSDRHALAIIGYGTDEATAKITGSFKVHGERDGETRGLAKLIGISK